MAETNPNGANQYLLDPRQKMCWEFYVNPTSISFGNATESARRAGYEETYCDTVSQSEWFCVKLWRLNATATGEKKMKQLLELPLEDLDGKIDIGLARIQADLAKYITSTQGKGEGYAARTEVTQADGKDFPTPILYAVPSNNSNDEGNGNEAENPGSAGGNVSEQDDIDPVVLDTPSAV